MRRALVVAVVVGAFASPAAASASGVWLVDPAGHNVRQYQRWVSRAPVTTVPWRITLHVPGDCLDGAGGTIDDYRRAFPDLADSRYGVAVEACSIPETKTIWMWEIDIPVEDRLLLFHELGHMFDAWRPAVRQATRLGTEQFADAYANCAMGRRWGPAREWFYDDHGYRATQRQHTRLCRVLRRPTSTGSAPRP